MHGIEFHCPDIDNMTREEIVEELRITKNEIVVLLEIAGEALNPSSIADLPTIKQLRERERERLQGISTEQIDAYVKRLNERDLVSERIAIQFEQIKARGDGPKHLGIRDLTMVRLHIKRLCNAGTDFGEAFGRVVTELDIKNTNDLYDLCTNCNMRPFEGE